MAKKDQDDVKQDDPGETSVAVNDAWTGMLAISLLALAVGTGFLTWDYMLYYEGDPPKGFKFTTTPPNPIKKADEAPAPKDGAAPAPKDGAKDAEKKDAEKKDG